ncbi:hypothetical protein A2627_00865 [Candidatus Woesebacteria bacterium RIFCSPHIGHO2_01_FULL_39_28]|uniref:Sce7726 family protein n=1 Tax=Candidatus Woesebacteria bacterium RIFCSPHIGHO2_01_FULL_39_28 TaxID=1802496 RepID=A0A1F7YI47_9BACT|nr:MAG: hypothetical protein A2627_00865 [Candidatus Woesebacteria bacterium RIFCSPHIGHO2_01_FULL_39_28]OGM58732.1 MAG: hypothetical protein A3A50_02995 [Candidatus Woesebacteria bacterium RIFCSPLOWO2_01_FULL_38_20]
MLSQFFNTTDKLIRSALLTKLSKEYKSQKNTAIISEFSLIKESARIDIAVVNGIMHGYELKSDKDNLLRLENQREAYNLIFDKVTLVVGKNHLMSSIYSVPDWWGITIAKVDNKNKLTFYDIRESKSNPEQNARAMTNLLWKNEILEKLRALGFSERLVNKSKDYVRDQLVCSLEQEQLKSYVRQALKKRFLNSGWRSGVMSMKYGDQFQV